MSYDRESIYLTWGGPMGGTGLDNWQCGVHLALAAPGGAPTLPSGADLLTLLAGPIKTFHTAAGTAIAVPCLLQWAKAARLDVNGHYVLEPVSATTGPWPGAKAAPYTGGPQLAAAITLWSGGSLGQANYGRFYVPWWEAACDSTARVIAPAVTDMATAAVALVDGINTWAGTAIGVGARIRIMSKLGTGSTKLATKVRVGNVKDTQQRRRRQLTEVYSMGTIAP